MGSSSQHFYGVVRIAERIEQAIEMKKIGGLTMDSRTIMRDESEDDSQVRNLSCMVQPGLTIASTTQMPLLKIDIPLPFEFAYQHLLDSRLISLTPSNLMQPPFSRWYNPDERCEYHSGVLAIRLKITKNSSIKFRRW
jgi:hypothetical protein